MFILVVFGYKQSKIFTTDCLTATLIDCIWINCVKDLQKILITKEEDHNKAIANLQKKINNLEKKIEQIDKQIEEEEKKNEDPTAPNATKSKKDDKKAPKVTGKKGKDNVPSNPLEAEKLQVQQQIEKSKESITKYEEKLTKLKVYSTKYSEIDKNEKLIVELLDRTGERKFVKTKLDQEASSFLNDKNTYILGYIQPIQNTDEEEKVEVLEVEGFCIRTVEEDEGAVDEPLIPKKDEKKKGKKGK